MYTLVKPQYAVPVHGEFKHLKAQAKLVRDLGIPKENTFLLRSGEVLELNEDGAEITGRVPTGAVLVDGLGVGDVGNVVLRDRQRLAQDGIVIVSFSVNTASLELVAGPDIISRGFVYMKESDDMIGEAVDIAEKEILKFLDKGRLDFNKLKIAVRDALGDYIWKEYKRRPMIMPVLTDITV